MDRLTPIRVRLTEDGAASSLPGAETDPLEQRLALWAQSKYGDQAAEAIVFVLLDGAGKLLGYLEHQGGGATANHNQRELLQAALLANARQVWVVHNHPSGNAQPTESDALWATAFKQLLSYFGIEVRGNVVVTKDQSQEVVPIEFAEVEV